MGKIFSRKTLNIICCNRKKLFSNVKNLQFTESSEALQKDVTCNKSKEHFLTAIRTLELMQVRVNL